MWSVSPGLSPTPSPSALRIPALASQLTFCPCPLTFLSPSPPSGYQVLSKAQYDHVILLQIIHLPHSFRHEDQTPQLSAQTPTLSDTAQPCLQSKQLLLVPFSSIPDSKCMHYDCIAVILKVMKKKKNKTTEVQEEPSIHPFLYSLSHIFYSKSQVL